MRNKDLTIRIKHISSNEEIEITLRHKVPNRLDELSKQLDKYHMAFADDRFLFDTRDEDMRDVAELSSSLDELYDWLWGLEMITFND